MINQKKLDRLVKNMDVLKDISREDNIDVKELTKVLNKVFKPFSNMALDYETEDSEKQCWSLAIELDSLLDHLKNKVDNELVDEIKRLSPSNRKSNVNDDALEETISRVMGDQLINIGWSPLFHMTINIGYDLKYEDGFVMGKKLFGGTFKMKLGRLLRKINIIFKANRDEDYLYKIAQTHGVYTADMKDKIVFSKGAVDICKRYKELTNITTCIMECPTLTPKFFEVHELMNCELASFKGEMGIQARVITYNIPGCNKAYGSIYVSNDASTNLLEDTFREELERIGYVDIHNIAIEYRKVEIDIRKNIKGGYLDNLYNVHLNKDNTKIIMSDNVDKNNGDTYITNFGKTYNYVNILRERRERLKANQATSIKD